MLFAEMSETLQIVNAVLGFLTVVIVSVVGPYMAVVIAKMKAEVTLTKVVAEKAVEVTEAGNKAVADVRHSQEVTNLRIDGMKTELVEAVRGQARAEGTLEGIASEQTRIAGDIQEIKTNGSHAEPSEPLPASIGPKVVAVVKAEADK